MKSDDTNFMGEQGSGEKVFGDGKLEERYLNDRVDAA